MSNLSVAQHDGSLVVDSRLIAEELGIEHEILEGLMLGVWSRTRQFLTAYDLLVIWQHSFYLVVPGLKRMPRVLDAFEVLLPEWERTTLAWMRTAITSEAALTCKAFTGELGHVHEWFRLNHATAIEGSSLVKVDAIERKRPDFLVEINNAIIPVECKLVFGSADTKQLIGYMKLWSANKGYAVATRFTTKLPDGITPILCPTSIRTEEA